ncbi:MAG: GIY-YIG nuclease family protein [Gemmatimonadaceae bacterium]|nr:GIY-YIG nuclease family protein [Gemmatimonadaceae bacterium]
MPIDRKALTREYKETPRTAGVAVVRCRENGKVLLIAGVDIPAPVNRHRAQLRLGAHPNRALQDDWKALGADAFDFEIVDTLPLPDTADVDQRDDVQALDAMWLEKLAPYAPAGYNRAPTAK